ncbi:MAG: permease [Bacteroidota bacterium]
MFDWISNLADIAVYQLLSLEHGTRLGEALHFFIYDSIKILLLLLIVTSIMGVINSYFPVEKLRSFLQRRNLFGLEYILASVFGAVTPFCSCSSVPLFVGFVQGGIPLGVTFSFLITSPLVNEVALALFLGLFGWEFTLIYALTGITLGTVGGMVLNRFGLESELSDWVQEIIANNQKQHQQLEGENPTFRQRVPHILREAREIISGVVLYVLIGIGIGSIMHGYVPDGFFEHYLGSGAWWTVPLSVLLAVPLYAGAAGVIPIIQVLVSKGVAIGTALAFMMGTVGLSLPEATMLKKVMTMKLIVIFFGVVTFFIIASGYFFNIVLA